MLGELFIGLSVVLCGNIVKYGWDHNVFPAWIVAGPWAVVLTAILLEYKPN